MPTIYVRNVAEALHTGLSLLKRDGIWQESRSGNTIEHPNPVMTIYKRPEERVLFYKIRDANPFFHLFEAFWMLAGKDNVDYVAQFNSRMKEFSDDGYILNGAYGYRWREYFLRDQLDYIVEHLKDFPNSRRAVLQMWCIDDLEKIVTTPECLDVPCNTQVYFKIRKERLQMTVCCRSNDIIWGAFGANAVHFSILQEYMAARIGVPIGTYYHLSDSFHAYEEPFEKCLGILSNKPHESVLWYDSYLELNQGMHYTPEPIFKYSDKADRDISMFVQRTQTPSTNSLSKVTFTNPFFNETATPMFYAWTQYKQQNYNEALKHANEIDALDWKKASVEWLERRREKWESKTK